MVVRYFRPLFFRWAHSVATQASRVGTYHEFVRLCVRERVDTVLDVGANRGQFASRIRAAGWRGRTVSFEPVADLHRRLVAAAAGDPKWIIADRVALGAQPGRSALNIASNDGLSSSFLEAKDTGRLYGTSFEYTGREEVGVVTLDTWAASRQSDGIVALKLDVQGYELHVLQGAEEILKRARVVMLEAPLLQTYSGAASFAALHSFMAAAGFRLANAHASTIDPATGDALELDVLFLPDGEER